MKNWKTAELVELNIAETANGIIPSKEENWFGGIDVPLFNGDLANQGGKGDKGDDTNTNTDTPSTPDTLS